MSNKRRDRDKRRNLNVDEMNSLVFVEMQCDADNEGWPYPDNDELETTENAPLLWHNGGRDQVSAIRQATRRENTR